MFSDVCTNAGLSVEDTFELATVSFSVVCVKDDVWESVVDKFVPTEVVLESVGEEVEESEDQRFIVISATIFYTV